MEKLTLTEMLTKLSIFVAEKLSLSSLDAVAAVANSKVANHLFEKEDFEYSAFDNLSDELIREITCG